MMHAPVQKIPVFYYSGYERQWKLDWASVVEFEVSTGNTARIDRKWHHKTQSHLKFILGDNIKNFSSEQAAEQWCTRFMHRVSLPYVDTMPVNQFHWRKS